MTFRETFTNSISVKPPLTPEFPVEAFVGSFYELMETTANTLPTILCGGTIEFPAVYRLACEQMDCHMLLYTHTGSGSLLLGRKVHTLTEGTFLYMDCSVSSYIIEAVQFPWRISLFLVRGSLLATLDSLVPFDGFLLHTFGPSSTHSPVLSGMNRLLSGGPDANLHNKLTDAALLHGILTDLFIDAWQLKAAEDKCAPYLSEIRQYLNTHFADPLRLDDLEQRYHISKYRICHEFSKAFGSPPVRYLNLRRLEAATHLLLTTDKRIHEISLDVGFENTNHFINLFKRETGMTPQAYRDANRG